MMVEPDLFKQYSERVEKELRGNILPFWSERVLDRENGGYYGSLTNDLQIDNNVPRSAVVAARILWTFSAAARTCQNPAYLADAQHAYAYLTGPVTDHDHGGVYWSVDRQGSPANDRKHIYAQAFAIYGLAEYFRATGDPTARSRAHDLFHLIEQHSFEPQYGGNIECLNRAWGPLDDMRLSAIDMNCRKSMNTLLHLMEAYTNFLRVWPDPELKAKQAGLIRVFLDHIIDPQTAHLRLFFDDAWNSLAPVVSFGHDIEAAWLLVEAAEVQGDHELLARARAASLKMAEAVYSAGRDLDGSIFYEGDWNNPHSYTKHWWVQCEGMVGFYSAYQLSGDKKYAEAALRCWDFIDAHLVDRQHGDWFKVLDRAGKPLPGQVKVGPWECPYHHARACLEMMDRLSS